ncbi:MAG: hypothetical protein HY319_31435 [Armatimonadetes bacterium]|nr:hypothetical protein [Armatimonadota bacterium]
MAPVKRVLLGLGLMLACAGPACAQTVSIMAGGRIDFPNVTLNGFPQVVTASGGPSYRIRFQNWAPATAPGFHVMLQSSDFTAGAGTIAASRMSFTATGGTITPMGGSPPGPTETGNSGTLDVPLTVLTNPPGIEGRWDYQTLPSNFLLDVPVEAYADRYSATVTATLFTGP